MNNKNILTNLLIAIYVRVSTGMQVIEGSSLEGQIELCINKLKQLGFSTESIKIFKEEGFTGEDIDRPAMNDLRQELSSRKFSHIICVHPDRLTRDLTDKLILCREFEKYDTELLFVDTEYKNTPEGHLFFNMMSSIAQYELSLIKKRTVRGRLKAVEKDHKIMPMRVAPYGYDLINGELIINEEEEKYVKLIFKWYVFENKTMSQIGESLYMMEAMPKRAESKNWSASSLGRILSSEIYIGKYYYNRRSTKKVKGGRTSLGNAKKTYAIRDKSEWISVDVPKIIDEGTFELAQQQKKKNFTRTGRNVKLNYLLKSLIRCSKCGRKWECTSYPSKNPNGVKYSIYRCPNKYPRRFGKGVEKCEIPTIRTDLLDELVWNMVVDAIKRPESIREHLSNDSDWQFDELKSLINVYEKQLEQNEKEKDKIKIMFRKNIITEKELEEDISVVMVEISKLQFEINKLTEKVTQLSRKSLSNERIKESIQRFNDLINTKDSFDEDEKKIVIDKLIDEIVLGYDKEKSEFTISFIGYLNGRVDSTVISTEINNNNDLVLLPQPFENIDTKQRILNVEPTIYFKSKFAMEQPKQGNNKPRKITDFSNKYTAFVN